MLSPVLDGFSEIAAVLGRFAQRAADDLWPSVGRIEHERHVAVRERHAQRLCNLSNVGCIEGQALGVAEHGVALQDETLHVECGARSARDQQGHARRQFLDQSDQRQNAFGTWNVVAVDCEFERRPLLELAHQLLVRADRGEAQRLGRRGPHGFAAAGGRERAIESARRNVTQVSQ